MSEFEYNRDPVKWIKGRTESRSGRSTLGNVARKKTEVMVKMTGCSKSYKHLGKCLEYISRNGKLELETDKGGVVKGIKDVKEFSKELLRDNIGQNSGKKIKPNQRVATAIIFSMPEGTDKEGVKNAVRELAEKNFKNKHSYAFALHTDTKHPHVHLIIHNKGLHGEKNLHLPQSAFQKLREEFAKALDKQGIEATASPRQVRGITQRAEKTPYYRVKQRFNALNIKTNVEKERAIQALFETDKEKFNKFIPPKPWEEKIEEKNKAVKRAWLNHAQEMWEENRDYAVAIGIFVKSMPKAQTRHQELIEKIQTRLDMSQQQQRQSEIRPQAMER